MLYSIYKKLQVGDLKPGGISLQLIDKSVKYPMGIPEDVSLQVGKFYIPYDFIVMEMEQDSCIPVILERPFLATIGAVTGVKNGKLSIQVGDEKVEFSQPQSMASPTLEDMCCRFSALESALNQEAMACHSVEDPLQAALIGC